MGIELSSAISGVHGFQFRQSHATTNPGYARFDMAASHNVTRGLFVTARAINLFDKQYHDALGFPALGRYYMFGLRYAFSGRN
jgi:outer membrane cobalamin receptor